MPIIKENTNTFPFPIRWLGSWGGSVIPIPNPSVPCADNTAPAPQSVLYPIQVMGLVPVFPCTETDCREGNYLPDSPNADDQQIKLPVFATLNSSNDSTDYKNDANSWLFQYPLSVTGPVNDFILQKYYSGTWNNVVILNNNTYGIYYNNYFGGLGQEGIACRSFNYQGFRISWKKILNAFGEGLYRFSVQGQFGSEPSYCFATPPFCLKTFECHAADRMVKFETNITGGTRGSATQQGIYWNFCCCTRLPQEETGCYDCGSITWQDEIRFEGFFGRQGNDFQRDFVKYQNGTINKIRDEMIKKFELWIAPMPQWFYDRFSGYALQADQLYVSDYNYNNANYNINRLFVVADSSVTPDHLFESRYARVGGSVISFKEGQQSIFADRCCG